MFWALYEYFNSFFTYPSGGLSGTSQVIYNYLTKEITLLGYSLQIGRYLCFLMAFISFVFILVLCCLFIYRIIRLVGGLITR